MNAKRTAPAPHGVRLSSLVWIVVFVAIFATTGVLCGLLKNHQIKVFRQIKEVEMEIVMFENDTNAAQVKINDHLGHFEIKARLAAIQSTLRPLSHGQVEVISETDLRRPRGGDLASVETPLRN